MKKLFSLLALFIFTAGMSIQAQDLDDILNSHFNTIGQKKLSKVNTFVLKGKVMQMGMEFPMTLTQKRPEKMRMEFEFQGMKIVQAYDGTNGWAIIPMTGSMEPQDMGEEEIKGFKQMADMDGDLYNWKEKGSELTLEGTEDMEGTEVFKLKLVKEDGDEFNYFIDSENYVILKVDAKVNVNGAEVESSTFFSNYKPVSGMIIAHNIEQRVNDQQQSQIVFESIEIDSEVDDSVFEKPKSSE